ncbi:MAG: M48 family metalloprotease [Desulfobacteraceae bacterium]|nr:M48 family metalloprotease [Desulfobacteraceae bacterium]
MLSFFCGIKSKRTVLAAMTAFLFALTLLCPAEKSHGLTLSEEKETGRKVLQMVRQKMSLVEDGEVLNYVRSIGSRIAKQVGITPYQYKFFVRDPTVPNAFAVPGGYIFIFRGMIEMMSSEGELASILAHEISHIQARHIQRQIDENKIWGTASLVGMVAALLLGGGGGAGPALAVGSVAAGQTAALQFSRTHEMEADQMGFRFYSDAGYDPSEMSSMMHKLDQLKWLPSARIPSYLSTHPALGERVQYLDEMANKQKTASGKSKLKPTVGDFQLMQATLTANYSDPAKALERFQVGEKKGEKAAVFGLGRLYLREDRPAEALKQLQEAARLMPTSPFVLSALGAAYHRAGKLNEAKRALETALTIDPSASIAHYRLAMVYQDEGKRSEALELLMRIEELAPMYPEVDYQLGIVMGQVNKLGLAHYYLGRYYLHKMNWPLAMMHFKKAKSLITDSPVKIEEVNLVIRELEKQKAKFGKTK